METATTTAVEARDLLEHAESIRTGDFGEEAFNKLHEWAKDLLTNYQPENIRKDMLKSLRTAVRILEKFYMEFAEREELITAAADLFREAAELLASGEGPLALNKMPEWAQNILDSDLEDINHKGMLKSLRTAVGILRSKCTEQERRLREMGIGTAQVASTSRSRTRQDQKNRARLRTLTSPHPVGTKGTKDNKYAKK